MPYPSESFERYIVPALFEPWAEKLIRFAQPRPGEHVLDVACGTGIVARRITPLVAPSRMVAGIDFNPNMVRVARQAAEREGLRIAFREGRAEHLPFGNASFDLVTCQFGLMLFDEPSLALREIRRILRPGGRLVLSVWQAMDRHPFYQQLHEASLRRLGTSVVASVYSLGDSSRLLQLLTAGGFQQVQIDPVTITANFPEPEEFLTWELTIDQSSAPAMREASAASWQAAVAALRADMQPWMEAAMQGQHLVLDFHAYLVRAARAVDSA